MKVCGKCLQEKLLEDFSWRSKSRGTKNKWCKNCMREYDRVRYTTTDRPNQARANTARSIERARTFVIEYLETHPCVDCGNSDLRVLQFDHLSNKVKDVSVMVRGGYGIDTIAAEIAKCEVRCANCHQIVTGERAGWWKSTLV